MDKYNETLNFIHSLGMYSNPPHTDLSKIKYLCNLFGNPQDSYNTIHIAGTNGKGSTTAMLFNIIKELGYKTGRFISPYIYEFTERIAIGENDISKDEIIFYVDRIKNTFEENNVPNEFMPNEFEFVTLLAFLYFNEKECETAIIETGLGGRIDPTNAIKSPLASVITSISLDHMNVLGDTVEKIAYEKCGIIKKNVPVVLYPLNSETVLNIVKKTAEEKNCEFIMPDAKFLEITEETVDFTKFLYKDKSYNIKLAGRHQVYNALTVIETINFLYSNRPDIYNAVYAGIEKTLFPSRFEVILRKPLVIFDGAHNISGVSALREAIKNLLPGKKIILICGMMRDKNPGEVLKNIAGESFVEKFISVPVNHQRAETPFKLCEIAAKYCENAEYSYDLSDAVSKAFCEASDGDNIANTAVVCFGSLYLASPVKSEFLKYSTDRI